MTTTVPPPLTSSAEPALVGFLIDSLLELYVRNQRQAHAVAITEINHGLAKAFTRPFHASADSLAALDVELIDPAQSRKRLTVLSYNAGDITVLAGSELIKRWLYTGLNRWRDIALAAAEQRRQEKEEADERLRAAAAADRAEKIRHFEAMLQTPGETR